METKMKMMTRAEKQGATEGGRERETERKRRKESKKKTERQNTDRGPKHLCSCANHFQDHKRLQALSTCLQVPAHPVLMRTPSSMKHGGKTMPLTIAAPHHGDWVALDVLSDAHLGIEKIQTNSRRKMSYCRIADG